VHRSPRSGHAHVKLRFVGLADSCHWHTHDHLVDCLALARVARHDKFLVNMEAASGDNFTLLYHEFARVYPGHSVQLVVPKFLSLALKVLRYPNPVTFAQMVTGLLPFLRLRGLLLRFDGIHRA